MAENYFELVGRIGWLDYKITDARTCICKINLGCKKDKENYENFFITFLGNLESKRNIAENFADMCKKGDYVRVKGSLRIDKFTPKGASEPVERLSLIGWSFNHVEFDEGRRCFVDV